ncbi:ALF repeat-containing protein [Streptomyces sp. NPDC001941]|uniref:ALF repeat-containing protein n=1 Tax=Streptomyces sp. NPDC001941 TaxID=3154659 RepID=UPI0033347103
MKLSRMAAAVTTAAVVPAVLLSPQAFAVGTTGTTGTSGTSGTDATTSGKGSVSARDQAEEDRIATLRILAEPGIGPQLKEAANKALDSHDPAVLRAFLEKGQYEARDRDNQLLVTQIASTGGPAVREAARKALLGTPEDRVEFLEKGQYEARRTDNRALVRQVISKGGPEVRKAGENALLGTDEELEHFLKVGQYEARKKDEANEAASKDEEKPAPKPEPDTDQSDEPAEDGQAGDSDTTPAPSVDVKPQGGTGALAATGAPGVLPWAATGAGLALAAGFGMVVVARRRQV